MSRPISSPIFDPDPAANTLPKTALFRGLIRRKAWFPCFVFLTPIIDSIPTVCYLCSVRLIVFSIKLCYTATPVHDVKFYLCSWHVCYYTPSVLRNINDPLHEHFRKYYRDRANFVFASYFDGVAARDICMLLATCGMATFGSTALQVFAGKDLQVDALDLVLHKPKKTLAAFELLSSYGYVVSKDELEASGRLKEVCLGVQVWLLPESGKRLYLWFAKTKVRVLLSLLRYHQPISFSLHIS